MRNIVPNNLHENGGSNQEFEAPKHARQQTRPSTDHRQRGAYRSNGSYYVTDERRYLHMIKAGSLSALRRKLLPIVWAEIADDPETEVVLQLVPETEIGRAANRPTCWLFVMRAAPSGPLAHSREFQ